MPKKMKIQNPKYTPRGVDERTKKVIGAITIDDVPIKIMQSQHYTAVTQVDGGVSEQPGLTGDEILRMYRSLTHDDRPSEQIDSTLSRELVKMYISLVWRQTAHESGMTRPSGESYWPAPERVQSQYRQQWEKAMATNATTAPAKSTGKPKKERKVSASALIIKYLREGTKTDGQIMAAVRKACPNYKVDDNVALTYYRRELVKKGELDPSVLVGRGTRTKAKSTKAKSTKAKSTKAKSTKAKTTGTGSTATSA